MTLLLAARHTTGWTIGADAICVANYKEAPVEKIVPVPHHPGTWTAWIGDQPFGGYWLEMLTGHEDLLSVRFHIDQAKRLRDWFKENLAERKDGERYPSGAYLLVQDQHCIRMSDNDNAWEMHAGYYSVGQGDEIADYLLRKWWHKDMVQVETEALMRMIFEEVSTTVPLIERPWQVVST